MKNHHPSVPANEHDGKTEKIKTEGTAQLPRLTLKMKHQLSRVAGILRSTRFAGSYPVSTEVAKLNAHLSEQKGLDDPVLNALVPGLPSFAAISHLLSTIYYLLRRPNLRHVTLAGLAMILTVSALLLQSPQSSLAAINEQLNFQARLLNDSGGLVADGNYNVQFNIYSGGDGDPATADEVLEWTGTHLNGNSDGVRVANGYLSVQLGSSSSQVNTLADVDWNNGTLWLSINIGDTGSATTCATEANFNTNCAGDGEMDPFMRLTSTPYAFNANNLDGRDSTEFVQLDPGATPQAVNTANSAIAINQSGAGLLLQLQAGGSDMFAVNTTGRLVLGNSSQQGSIRFNDGSSHGGTLEVADFDGNYTLTIPNPGQNDNFCLELLANCGSGGSGALFTDGGTFVYPTTGEDILLGDTTTANADIWLQALGSAIFNQQQADADFRVAGQSVANLFFVDASANRIGIGTNTPSATMDVQTAAAETGLLVQGAAAQSADLVQILDDGDNELLVVDAAGNVIMGSADNNAQMLVVDIKNTTGDPTGQDGAIYYNSSMGKFRCYESGAWKNCIGVSGGGQELIREFILSSDTDFIDFNSIPGDYSAIYVEAITRSTDTTTTAPDEISLRLGNNGTLDSGTNYDYLATAWNNSGSTFESDSQGATSMLVGRTTIPEAGGTGANTNERGYVRVDLPNYRDENGWKIAHSEYGTAGSSNYSGSIRLGDATGNWRSTEIVDTIRVLSGGGDFAAGSIFRLWGVGGDYRDGSQGGNSLVDYAVDTTTRAYSTDSTWEDVDGTEISFSTANVNSDYVVDATVEVRGTSSSFWAHFQHRLIVDGVTTFVTPQEYAFAQDDNVDMDEWHLLHMQFVIDDLPEGNHDLVLQTRDNASGNNREYRKSTVTLSGPSPFTSGSGGGSIFMMPIDVPKTSVDTPDDEFNFTALDNKWTEVDGTAGTINPLIAGSTVTQIYDLQTRPGWLMMQTGTADPVTIRQDYTLADGDSIVVALSSPFNQHSGNDQNFGFGLNDNDTGPGIGNFVRTFIESDSGAFDIQAISNSSPTGTELEGRDTFSEKLYLRINRVGLVYSAWASIDGTTWTHIMDYTAAGPLNNLWITGFGSDSATYANTAGFDWIRLGSAGTLDPWPINWRAGAASFGTTLQGAYDNDLQGPADITTTDSKDLLFNMADTTTDSDFIIDLQGSDNEFLVQADGTDVLAISPTSVQIEQALIVNATSTFNESITVAATKTLTLTGGTTLQRPGSPTEGMLYFDTDTDSLLIYANGKWQADRAESIIVAASDSTQAEKDSADYVADGTDDQVQINAALTEAAGGKVYLLPGTYVTHQTNDGDATIFIPNNTTLSGAGSGTLIELGNIDATDNLIQNTDTSTGTGVVIKDLSLDGRSDLNTVGTQRGISFSGIGDESTNLNGGQITNVWVEGFRSFGIHLTNSDNNSIENAFVSNNDSGVYLTGSSYNTISSTTSQNNTQNGFWITSSSTSNKLVSSVSKDNGNNGVLINSSSGTGNMINSNSISSNTTGIYNAGPSTSIIDNIVESSTGIGIYINSSNNLINSNSLSDNSGATVNNSIYLDGADGNTITSNHITDTSCTTTCHAINISNSTSDNNYLADNNLGTNGTINDAGTGTIYGGQVDENDDYLIQPAGDIELLANTDITGNLTVSGTSGFTGLATFDGNLRISDGSSNYATIAVESLAGDYTVSIPTITGNDTFCLEIANNCSGGSALSLQGAYDNSSIPATIVTSSAAKDIILQSGTGFDSTTMFQILDADGNAPVLNVDTVNERVGIGTANPDSLLDIAASAGNALRLRNGTDGVGGTDNQILFSYNGGALYSSAIRSRHHGLTPDYNGIDFYIWSDAVDADAAVASTRVLAVTGRYGGSLSINDSDVLPDATLQVNNKTSTADIVQIQDNGTAVFVIQDGGNVGIGDTTPDAKLDVESTGAVTSTNYGQQISNLVTNSTTDAINKYGLHITSTGTFTGLAGTATNNYGLYVATPTGADNNYAAVFQGGNVGIGTASPTSVLNVSGLGLNAGGTADLIVTGTGTTGSGVTLNATGTGGVAYSLMSTANAATVGGGNFAIYNDTANEYVFVLESNGRSAYGNGTIGTAFMFLSAPSGTEPKIRGWTEGAAVANDLNFYESGTGNMVLQTNVSSGIIFKTAGSNTRLTVESDGDVLFGASGAAGVLRVSDGSSNYVSLTASGVGSDFILTLPATTGSANECLANSATPGILTFAACGGGGSLFTDNGTFAYLTTNTDDLVVGASTDQSAKLSVIGDADEIQLRVKANATQTAQVAVFENSSGTDFVSIDASFNLNLLKEATATVGSPQNSQDLVFQGSAWDTDGAVAVDRQISQRLITSDSNDADYRLGFLNDAGTEFVTFDGFNERVGIGTATPSSLLTIGAWAGGNTNDGALKVKSVQWPNNSTDYAINIEESSGSESWQIGVTQQGDLNFYDSLSATPVLTLNESGFVGIINGTPSGKLDIEGNITANAWGLNGINLQSSSATITDDSTVGTATNAVFNSFGTPTLAATNASVTTTNAATVYIQGAPTAGTNQTITNPYALWVDGGNVRFDGNITDNLAFVGNDFSINSNDFDLSSGGGLSGITGYTQGSGGFSFSSGSGDFEINSNDFDLTAAGVLSGIAGYTQGSGGFSFSGGDFSINSNDFDLTATGVLSGITGYTQPSGGFSFSGGDFSINSNDFDLTAAGVLSGIAGYTQNSGQFDFSSTSDFSVSSPDFTLNTLGAATFNVLGNNVDFTVESDTHADALQVTGSSGAITLGALDCTGNANGGALTADDNGLISCTDDDGGAGSAITGSGANGQIAYFDGASTLTSSGNFLFNGATFTNNLNTILGSDSSDTLIVNATSTFNESITVAATKTLTLTGGTTLQRPGSPTEGMLYFDTDTDSLLTYANGKWQADRAESIIVAANDSTQAEKDSADYVADGTDDQVQINDALVEAAGGKVYLLPGTYVTHQTDDGDATIFIPNNTTLVGAGTGTLIELGNIDATDNLIGNTDISTGTSVVIKDLSLDGRSDLNTVGFQSGIKINADDVLVQNVRIADFTSSGIDTISAGDNVKILNNFISNVGSGAILAPFNGNSLIKSNIIDNANWGILLTNYDIADGNYISNTNEGIRLYGNSNGSIVSNNQIIENDKGITTDCEGTVNDFNIIGNIIQDNLTTGIEILCGHDGSITSNRLINNGGSTTNEAIILSSSDRNQITSNQITDTSCTTNCHAINISNSTSDNNYLADNNLGTNGTINDLGTGTIYGGQVDENDNYLIQPAGDIELLANTDITGNLTVSGTSGFTGLATFDGNLRISDGSTNYVTLTASGVGSDFTLTLPTTIGGANECLANTATPGILTFTACGGGGSSLFTDGGTFVYPTSDEDIVLGSTTTGGADIWLQATGGAIFNQNLNDVDFRVAATGQANALFVDGADGSIGIGLAAPNAQLHVAINDDATTPIDVLLLENQFTGQDVNWSFTLNANKDLEIASSSGASDLSFSPSTGAADLLYLDGTNARVGIGTDTPDTQLDIEGASADGVPLVSIQNTTTSGELFYGYNTAGFAVFELNVTGSNTASVEINNEDGSESLVLDPNNAGGRKLIITTDETDALLKLDSIDNGNSGLEFREGGGSSGLNLLYNGISNAFVLQTTSAADGTDDVLTIQRSSGAVLFQNHVDSQTAFQIKDVGGTNFLTVDTESATNARILQVGSASSDATGVLLVLDSSTAQPTGVAGAMYYDSTNGKFKCYTTTWGDCDTGGTGGGGNTMRVTLLPEFAGGTLHADGSNNNGTMTADYDTTARRNYYQWTASNPTTLQDYQIVINTAIPSDYASSLSGFNIWARVSSLSNLNNDIHVQVLDTAGTSCHSASVIPTGTIDVWEEQPVTLSGCTFSADSNLTIIITVSALNNNNVRVGPVRFEYTN